MLNLSITVLAMCIPGFHCREHDSFKKDLEVPGTGVGPPTEHLLDPETGVQPVQENARFQAIPQATHRPITPFP